MSEQIFASNGGYCVYFIFQIFFATRVVLKIGHFRITFSLYLKASLGAHLSYENEISFTCKLNSFSYEWLCTRPRFEREALGNSEMVYSLLAHDP